MDFAKPVKAISLPQDVPSTSNFRLIELKNQVQRLMEAHLAPKSSVQVNKITFSYEICSGPHDTQYCMENLEQAFIDYESSRTAKREASVRGDGVRISLWRRQGSKATTSGCFVMTSRKVKGIKVFVGNFTYECDFMFLEDVSSVIDHYLGTVMFEKNDERVTFKMPHKMERFKDIEDLNTDNIPPFFVASKGDEERGEGYVSRKRLTHYSGCLELGPEYKHDEGIIKRIKFLNGRSSSMNNEGVT
ncbi:hypothetical protein Tco_0393116 [Tanacetum coccineum]